MTGQILLQSMCQKGLFRGHPWDALKLTMYKGLGRKESYFHGFELQLEKNLLPNYATGSTCDLGKALSFQSEVSRNIQETLVLMQQVITSKVRINPMNHRTI